MINQDSADLDIQQEGFDFQKFFDKKCSNQEPQKEEVHKSNQSESQQQCQGDTLRALVKNIKIEKQVAGRNKKNKKIQWNEKNTKIFKDLYQQYSGNLDQILLYFQQNNELKTKIDIKQIKNKFKIEKKKKNLTLLSKSQIISKNLNYQLKLD
ncbi:unnamed protein product (macronuclear) [Paramecium tetraurelia]|uniref:Uncharacterized protein n=1 Tax=Paramecium tetraurelia TaxID=5888 RepID=A0CH69_PARTE|nr:uncharacterized protein GSPATT00007576001 [Paramecium tetraurelia]CAK70136.1 unnamed protein product [Paramecium tetraurelia]|eukprot:XP_001437533.1 hypothetical protein (macronuclear) [Paramecium tetraurelia strain d4-2]